MVRYVGLFRRGISQHSSNSGTQQQMMRTLHSCTFVALVGVCMIALWNSKRPVNDVATAKVQSKNAVSGHVFDGKSLMHPSTLNDKKVSTLRQHSSTVHENRCNTPIVAVVTTLKEHARCVDEIAKLMPVVVVGDEGSKSWKFQSPQSIENITYLSLHDQKNLYADFHDEMPVRHFARKNFGYLHAVLTLQACNVWDFDDDNCATKATGELLARISLDQKVPATDQLLYMLKGTVVNPYLLYGSPEFIWPRGFPLEHLSSKEFPSIEKNPGSDFSVDVLQVMQTYDPDVDAVWRLLHGLTELPMKWRTESSLLTKVVGIHPAQLAPFNAQSTVVGPRALPFLYLPHTIHGRVSDIWRSYIVQYLLGISGGTSPSVGFIGAFVVHERNSHDYMADMDAESQLYSQVRSLTSYLQERSSSEDNVADEYLLLMDDLYRRGYVGKDDVKAVRVWISYIRHYTGKVVKNNTIATVPPSKGNLKVKETRVVDQVSSIPLLVATREHSVENTIFAVRSEDGCHPGGISGIPVSCLQSCEERHGVVGILSSDGKKNRALRMSQRETWVQDSAKHSVKVFFLLDTYSDEAAKENGEYGDIIFLNATYSGRAVRFGEKLSLWFEVAHAMFPHASFVGKIDDDCLVCPDKMWPYVWDQLSPGGTSYIGILHTASCGPGKINQRCRHDEMFVLVGKELVSRIVERKYCHDLENCNQKVDLFDMNYGGTSLGLWLSIYDDIHVTELNDLAHVGRGDLPEVGCAQFSFLHPVKDPKEMVALYEGAAGNRSWVDL